MENQHEAGSGCPSHDLLAKWVTPEAIESAKSDFDEDTPAEVLVMAAALWTLANTTTEESEELARDGRHLSAESTEDRANRYHDSYWSLVEMWR